MSFNPAGGKNYTLASSISSTQDSILLSSFKEPVSGTPYTMTNLNTSIAYGTIGPRTSQSEFISFTGITQNADDTATLTGVVRGLQKKSPYTASATFRLPHAGQSIFILSDAPQVFNEYAALQNDNTFEGTNSFTVVPNTDQDPVTGNDIARRSWVLSVVNGGPVSMDALVIQGRSGEAISTGQAVYLKASDGLWYLTDADTVSTIQSVQIGIAQGSGTTNNPISGGILLMGMDTNNIGTAGSLVYISNTPGGLSTSAGTNSKVVGQYVIASGGLYFDPFFYGNLTDAQVQALAGGGVFGSPSSTNKFITQDYLSSSTGVPIVRAYLPVNLGAQNTRFDITNPAGTTFRYTYDGTGTNPNINATTVPTGTRLSIFSELMSAGNSGTFTVTGSGTNYFEVTNASGVAENDKTLQMGFLYILQTIASWTKPSGLKYITIEVQAGGGGGSRVNGGGAGGGGGGGGYSRKILSAGDLLSNETFFIGAPGFGGNASVIPAGTPGGNSIFGSVIISATGGSNSGELSTAGGAGGASSGGYIDITGGHGSDSKNGSISGYGGSSQLGHGGAPITSDSEGQNAYKYGSGGSGAYMAAGSESGGHGSPGCIIITEYYS